MSPRLGTRVWLTIKPCLYTILRVSTCSSRDLEKGKSPSHYSRCFSPSFLFQYLLKITSCLPCTICWMLLIHSCLLWALGNVSPEFLQATDLNNDTLCHGFYSFLRLCLGALSVTCSHTFSRAVCTLVFLRRAAGSPTCGCCDGPLGSVCLISCSCAALAQPICHDSLCSSYCFNTLFSWGGAGFGAIAHQRRIYQYSTTVKFWNEIYIRNLW